MRSIIIADVHGCDQALLSLLDKAKPTTEDRIILLGDLFDRGKHSYQVFRIVKKVASVMGERFILLRGNHEDYLLTPKLTLAQRLMWERVGRAETVKSFKAHDAKMEDAIPWLKKNTQLFWRGDGFQCVHAGLMVDPIEVNDVQTMVHDHGIVLHNRYVGPLTIVGHIALASPTWFAGDGKTTRKLVYGKWQPLPGHGTICIDTGSGKGGNLTAMIVEGKRYYLEKQ